MGSQISPDAGKWREQRRTADDHVDVWIGHGLMGGLAVSEPGNVLGGRLLSHCYERQPHLFRQRKMYRQIECYK
jgi:hypothetical protein